jgi:hypothetical protein
VQAGKWWPGRWPAGQQRELPSRIGASVRASRFSHSENAPTRACLLFPHVDNIPSKSSLDMASHVEEQQTHVGFMRLANPNPYPYAHPQREPTSKPDPHWASKPPGVHRRCGLRGRLSGRSRRWATHELVPCKRVPGEQNKSRSMAAVVGCEVESELQECLPIRPG